MTYRVGLGLLFCIVSASAACVACGGDTTGSTGGGPGSGTGGSQNGGNGGSGVGGSGIGGTSVGGAGGSNVGGASLGGASGGNVQIGFTIAPGRSYCSKGCSDSTPHLDITTKDGVALDLGSMCQVDCTTCQGGSCPPIACAPPFQVNQGLLDWDGLYFTSSFCGDGLSCKAPNHAPAGTYNATFCATPGYVTGPAADVPGQCIQTGPPECATIQFEFPSDRGVNGVLGTPQPIGR